MADLIGTDGDDVLVGSDFQDNIQGLGGNDTITGGAGADQLDGGTGDDAFLIAAAAEHNWNETITGGDGNDVIRFTSTIWGDRLFLEYGAVRSIETIVIGNADGDTSGTTALDVNARYLLNAGNGVTIIGNDGINNLIGTAFADALIGNGGDDTFGAGGGSDTIDGGAGSDTVIVMGDLQGAYVDLGAGYSQDDEGVDTLVSIENAEAGWLGDTLIGSSGANRLAGMGGADSLSGLAGNDFLDGGDGNDMLDGGADHDTLVGGAGDDVYLASGGQDTIYDQGGYDTLRFGPAVAAGEVERLRGGYSGYDLVLRRVGTTDSVTIWNWFFDPLNQVERIEFDDGTVWDTATASSLRVLGTAGDDFLNGSDHDERIEGRGGNDQIMGGGGNDEYVPGFGGADLIYDQFGFDTLRLDGVAPGQIERIRDGYSLVLRHAGTQDKVTIYNWFWDPMNQIEQIAFDNGTVWDAATASSLIRIGTAGDDLIDASFYDERIEGRGGSDTLIGAEGNDTYLPGFGGQDVIVDLGGDDTLLLDGGSPAQIERIREPGSDDLVLRNAATGDTVRIYNWFFDPLYQIEHIVFDDGTVWGDELIYGTQADDVLHGGPGNDQLFGLAGNDAMHGEFGDDTLHGGDGADLLVGGGGQDDMYGGTGDDRYVVDDSQDAVFENADEGVDAVESSVAHVLAAHVENLTLTGTTAVNGVGNELANVIIGNAVDNIMSGNGGDDAVYGMDGHDDLFGDAGQDALSGGAGSDWLRGGDGDDSLDGGTGNDTMIGGAGSDTYVFARGSGADWAWELFPGLADDMDRVIVAADIQPSDITVTYVEPPSPTFFMGGFLLSVDGTSDSMRVVWRPGEGPENLVEEVVFADGTVWREAELRSFAIQNGHAPTLQTALADQAAAEDAAFSFTIPADTFADADAFLGDTLTYSALAPGWLTFDPATRTFSGIPVNANVGTVSVQVTATDASGRSVSNAFYLTVANTNDAPAVANPIADQSAQDETPFTFTVPANTFADPDAGDSLTYTSGPLPAWLSFDPATRTFSGTPAPQDTGTRSIQLTATDASGASATDEFVLTVAYDGVINGTEGDDTLVGTAGDDDIFGYDGNDQLDGGAGADHLAGGAGDDTYVVDNAGDSLVEVAGGGIDSVMSSVSWTLGDEFENLTLTGTDAIDAMGTLGANVIIGNSANNVLNGGAGADTLIGGAGDDSYFFGWPGGVTIVENPGEGFDTVYVGASDPYYAPANIERLFLYSGAPVYGNELDNQIYGNHGWGDFMDGGAGADLLVGYSGDDTYIVDNAGDVVVEAAGEGRDIVKTSISLTIGDNIEELWLIGDGAIDATGSDRDDWFYGNSAANVLTGGLGNDMLSGGYGVDTMIGGAGDDIYQVADSGDVIVENAGEGLDGVWAYASYTLAANVENLDLSVYSGLTGTGNDLDNRISSLTGGNTLIGGAGNDWLIGGTDTLIGGTGNDVYQIGESGAVIIENAGEGTDSVESWQSYTLAANVESLQLMGTDALDGTGNALANSILGNSAANVLDGAAGADSMSGLHGDDTYVVDNAGDVVTEFAGLGNDTVLASVSYTLSDNVENLTLTGDAALNGTGNALDNLLTGNTGNNTLAGGAGNDTYVLQNSADIVVENTAGGIDTVRSSVSHTLSANVENLELTGTASINGTGNALDNVLSGNVGANKLSGGAGNDTYIIDDAQDTVSEANNAGTDTVRASISYTLGNNVENLVLTGSGDISGTGNNAANAITGNAGSNTLTGRNGLDSFYLMEATGVDHITDFAASERLYLDDLVFADIGPVGNFVAGDERFHAAAGATGGADASDRVVYDTASGRLYYDADGSGLGAATLVAVMDNLVALTATNIAVT